MVTHISNRPEDTEAIARALAEQTAVGTVVGLIGDLGAGKTLFAREFARALGVRERVQSPTYALVHLYHSGRCPFYHLDFYRLESDAQIIGAGLDEYFQPDGIALIEWMDRWHGPRPRRFVQVLFESLSETSRRLTLHDDARP